MEHHAERDSHAVLHRHADGTVHTHDLYPNHHAHPHPLPHAHAQSSRRDFFRTLLGGALAGASVLELAYHRAAWASAAAPSPYTGLFDLQQATDGVFFAHAHVQAMINCNAAIFVRSNDVVIVDAHSKPAAAAALIMQIQREITTKPVRYLINSHFHWDHTQGNLAYTQTGNKVDIIATSMTRQLMTELSKKRMQESIDTVPGQIEKLSHQAESATSAAEKDWCADQIRQLKAYQVQLHDYPVELPTITFDKSYVLSDPAFDLHLDFHGRAHTSGDLFVLCPQRRALATGDASHCWLPNLADGYPTAWPRTIDEVAKGDFKYTLGGHGPMQSDRTVMMSQRNYIEELTERVEEGKKAGQSLEEMQKRITVASLRSMQSNGYAAFVDKNVSDGNPHWGPSAPLQEGVSENVRHVYQNLDRA